MGESFEEFTPGMFESIARAGTENQDVVKKLARCALALLETVHELNTKLAFVFKNMETEDGVYTFPDGDSWVTKKR